MLLFPYHYLKVAKVSVNLTVNMPFSCSFCSMFGSVSPSEHKRICHKAIFSVHAQPLSKQGPEILIKRFTSGPSKGRVQCQCVDSEGKVCDKDFLNMNGLFKHLKTVNHDQWKVCRLTTTMDHIRLIFPLSFLHQKSL